MFSDRIQKRKQLWWRNPNSSQTFIDHLRRLEMLLRRVGREAPESRWRKGEHWQRRLLNKLNSKEFAIRLNCPVPKLYWQGRFLTLSVLSSLPEQFVLKPALGTTRKGVYVVADSRELLSDKPMTRDQLLRQIASTRGRLSHIPLLAEEFVSNENGEFQLPIEYKFHVFADTIGAIEVVHRSASIDTPTTHRFYSPQWQSFDDPMQTSWESAEIVEAPNCLPQMIDCALKLGGAFDTFVRVDLYASENGCVFGEFSSVPYSGNNFTDYANNLFETLWRQKLSDKI